MVGSTEANSLVGKISNESPVGKALIGKKVGDVVAVETQAGDQYKVLRSAVQCTDRSIEFEYNVWSYRQMRSSDVEKGDERQGHRAEQCTGTGFESVEKGAP